MILDNGHKGYLIKAEFTFQAKTEYLYGRKAEGCRKAGNHRAVS